MSDNNKTSQYLSELKDDQKAIITKVLGHGAFRKRITEMGFVKGKTVKVIKNAPLQDPIEYEIMDFHVSLRRSEASLVEIVPLNNQVYDNNIYNGTITENAVQEEFREKSRTINIALVGNPNSGKTTLFNHATGKHERVGNYGGVTVDTKEAVMKQDGYTFNITDLPGTYSISEYSPEELFVRQHLSDKMPDIVINVLDASNLERNLFLTSQLMDMNIKVVIALNMYDELEKKGDNLNYNELGKIIGIPVIPTIASKGEGLKRLFSKVIDVYENNDPDSRHVHINYGSNIEEAVDRLKKVIKKNKTICDVYYPRYTAIKLIESDMAFLNRLSSLGDINEIIEQGKKEIASLEAEYKEKSDTIIADAKYGFINGVLKETFTRQRIDKKERSESIDFILTHKYLGFPIFIAFLWAMFQITFSLGSYPMDWIETGVGMFGEFIGSIMAEGSLKDLIVDGIIGGVGGVIVFLPNILILFFCISLMEDTGYMARAAFIMDKLMHKMGLHGKSFIPLIMGFGCNVPAVMATRTLDNRKDRILTMIVLPFMSCSARLPVYVLLISAFFPSNQGLVLLSIYIAGIMLAVIAARIFKKLFFAKQDVPFVMELPPYRIPTIRNITVHMWNKSVQYLTKMGTVILTASIIIWALGYFPRDVEYSKNYDAMSSEIENNSKLSSEEKESKLVEIEVNKESERMEKSYIGQLGHFISPVIQPLGWDWKIGVSIITGLAAKEIVVGSMGVLYQSDLEADENSVNLKTKLQQQKHHYGHLKGEKVFSPLIAYSLMLFILIYFPCVAVIAAIRREADWKWALFTTVYTTILAYVIAFIVYKTGSLF